jgi:RNA polymerase sigma-70 factor, ECF subfamily
MNDDERERLERFRRGEPGAFDSLYAAYGPRIYRFSLRLCGNAEDAEDVTQETFLGAYRGLHRFEGRSSLTTYLYRIAVYRWRQMRTAGQPETVRWEERDSREDDCGDPARLTLARMELAAALETLSDAQREAFLLVKSEGLTCREAAETLDIPVGTVKYHVHQAVHRLQRCLRAECEATCETAETVGTICGKEATDAL